MYIYFIYLLIKKYPVLNYRAGIWHNCLEAAAHTPNQRGHGWEVIDGHISIHWIDQRPAPKVHLQCISCNCLKCHYVGGRCSCRKNVMSSTDACCCVDRASVLPFQKCVNSVLLIPFFTVSDLPNSVFTVSDI